MTNLHINLQHSTQIVFRIQIHFYYFSIEVNRDEMFTTIYFDLKSYHFDRKSGGITSN